MTIGDILSKMDELDIFMLNNVDANNGIFKFDTKPEEILDANKRIDDIRNALKEIDGNGRLKQRFKSLDNAFFTTLGEKNNNEGKMYFTWLKDTKIGAQEIQNPEQATTIVMNALNVQRLPRQEIVDYLMQEANGNKEVAKNLERLMYPINAISNIGKTQESKALINPPKENIVKRIINAIKDKFKKRDDVATKNNIENTPPTLNVVNEKPQANEFLNSIKTEEKPRIQPETLCVSDLHGNMDLWNATKERLARHNDSKLIVLGDAMDRGEYGLEILLQIKDLCDKGKAIYVPGNHDESTYNYLKTYNDPKWNTTDIYREAEFNWLHNGGQPTHDKMLYNFEQVAHNLNSQKKYTLDELINWLGKQPIQRAADINGQRYAISHAQFDEQLYKYNPNFCLEDGLNLLKREGRESKNYKQFKEVLWYREGKTKATTKQQGTIYLIGHTPQENVKLSDGEKGYAILNLDTHSSNAKFSAYNLNTNKAIELVEDVYKTR